MKKLRRQDPKVEISRAEDSLEQVFLALYYRHEFARRHETVFKRNTKIAGLLGISDETLRTFVQPNQFLTDVIINHIEGSENRAKGAKREVLKEYLKECNVIPMTWDWDEKRHFFPREFITDVRANFRDCYEAFKALLGFEAYALAVLKVGHPVMFPIMPLRIKDDKKTVTVEQLCLGDYSAPVLVDYSAPKTSFDSYNYLMSLDQDVCKHRPDKLKRQDARQPESEEDGHTIERLKPEFLDKHLQVLDVARYWTKAKRPAEIARFYSVEKLGQTLARKNVTDFQKDHPNIELWFSQQLKRAKPYEKGYRDII